VFVAAVACRLWDYILKQKSLVSILIYRFLSPNIKLHVQYMNILCVSTLFNKLVTTDVYTLTFMRLYKFYKIHVQHMLSETDLSNQVKMI